MSETVSYVFCTLIKLHYIKSSEWSSLVTDPRWNSSPLEAKNPSVIHSSSQQHFNTKEILPELRVLIVQSHRLQNENIYDPPNLCSFTGGTMWVRKIPWGRHGNPLQYSFLENPMDREAWRATVHRLAEWDTNEVTLHSCTLICREIIVTDNMKRPKIEIQLQNEQ